MNIDDKNSLPPSSSFEEVKDVQEIKLRWPNASIIQ